MHLDLVVLTNVCLVQQILNHMNESAVYNETDLRPFQKRLAELRQIVQQDAEHAKNPKAVTKLLERQLNECGVYLSLPSQVSLPQLPFRLDAIVRQLQESLSVLSPELVPLHQKLVTIRRQLVALAAKEGTHKAELKPLQEELRRIDSLSIFSLRLISIIHNKRLCVFAMAILGSSHSSLSLLSICCIHILILPFFLRP